MISEEETIFIVIKTPIGPCGKFVCQGGKKGDALKIADNGKGILTNSSERKKQLKICYNKKGD